MLDLTDRRTLIALLGAAIDGDPAAALEACGRALDSGTDPKRLANEVTQLLRDLVVLEVAPKSETLVEGSDSDLEELRALAGRTETARLRRMFRAFVKEQEDLAWAPQPAAVLEMAILRIATLPAGDEVANLLARLDALERRLAGSGGGGAGGRGGGGRAPAARAPVAETAARSPEAPVPSRATAAPTPAAAASTASAPRPPVQTAGPPDDDIPPPESEHPGPVPSPPAAAASGPGGDALQRLRNRAREEQPGLVALLEGAQLTPQGEDLILSIPQPLQLRRLRDKREVFEALCQREIGCSVKLEAGQAAAPERPGASHNATPGISREQARKQRQAALEHPAVNIAIEELGAEIVEIRPLG